ncbi:hypothetical protein HHI36_002169, partial [Cryptolaemus montrouzieri]
VGSHSVSHISKKSTIEFNKTYLLQRKQEKIDLKPCYWGKDLGNDPLRFWHQEYMPCYLK